MKRIILAALGSALLLPSQAQQKNKEYTNFNDSVFSINEVVVATNYRRKTDALKLDVPAKFIPISTNSITSGMLEKRNIRDIQEASRFLPGVRFRTSYGAFTQFTIRCGWCPQYCPQGSCKQAKCLCPPGLWQLL